MATNNKEKDKNTQKKATTTSKKTANTSTKKNTTKSVKKDTDKKTTQNSKMKSNSAQKATNAKKSGSSSNKNSSTKNKKTTTSSKKSANKNSSKSKNVRSVKDDITKSEKVETAPSKTLTIVEQGTTPQVIKDLHVDEELITAKEEKPIEKKRENSEEIRSILGAQMPIGDNAKEKKQRQKFYLIDALVFSIVIPVLDLFAMLFIEVYKPILVSNSDFVNYGVTVLVDFVLIFIITYVIDYVFGEEAVKKINKK